MSGKLFISPHNDDAVLFGAFTLDAERPTVLTVFDSHVQAQRGHAQCDAMTRRREDQAAVTGVLGCPLKFACIPDDADPITARMAMGAALRKYSPTEVWLPEAEEGGHAQHNLVANVGTEVFALAKVRRYLTYTARGKSSWGWKVPCTGAMVRRKLMALSCYRTQMEIDELGCWQHFLRDQSEYLAA